MLRHTFLESLVILGGFFAGPGVACNSLRRAGIRVPSVPLSGYRYLQPSQEAGGGFILFCGPAVCYARAICGSKARASPTEKNKAS
jgi:hypothetical protein